MRRFFCILMCLSMASMVSALSITNGDFEAPYEARVDVPDWFDYTQGTWAEQTFYRTLNTPTGTQYMGFADDDDCWAYQSIGFNTGGLPALRIQYDIGSFTDAEELRDLGIIVSIYESDGSFVGSDGPDSSDIDGAEGVTLIDSFSYSYPAMAIGQVVTDANTLHYINSASGELFLRIANTGDFAAIDNVQIVGLPSIVNPFPKDGTESVAIELDSPENDLKFTVADEDIIEVDVLFGPDDPNQPLSWDPDKIVEGMSVSEGQYTITLESEWPQDLEWSTQYTWQVLAYEPNDIGSGSKLKYTSLTWSFTTIQEGPLLGDVTPEKLVARIGEDAVFGLTMNSKADTFQWYKEGDPDDIELSDSDPNYSGVTTDTLTINDAQLDDAGFYYCIGTETATELTAQSLTSGELRIGQLKSHYPFEDTYTVGSIIYTPDIISGKDMQLVNGASVTAADPNLMGKHLLLENPNGAKTEWANITDNTVAHYEDITISCWVNPTTLINSNDRDRWNRVWDFGIGDATECFFLTMLYRQDDPRQGGWDVARSEWNWYTIEDGEPVRHNQELDVESQINTGEWYYVVLTVEDGAGRIYLSGEHGTENESPQGLNVLSPIEFTKTYNYIGKPTGYTDVPYLNARIDDFKIYNYALTSEEIAEEYNRVTGVEFICDLEIYDLYDWDYDRNCKVDLGDFAEIAARWLAGYRIYPD